MAKNQRNTLIQIYQTFNVHRAALPMERPILQSTNFMTIIRSLEAIGLQLDQFQQSGGSRSTFSPIDGQLIGEYPEHTTQDAARIINQASGAFKQWRTVPAPVRGELIRQFGNQLREHKALLGSVITHEVGKVTSEGLGEVQEMIDICDFAVGLSRQLYGLTIASERPMHALRETWHPMGPVGVITAFNFPMAVWAWNTALALVCGNTVIWKPSEKSSLCAMACQHILDTTIQNFGDTAPPGIAQLLLGDAEVADVMVASDKIPIISATGSCAMGQQVAPKVAQRFGRCILELGGNNAAIVTESADLKLAIPAIAFGAAGTAGQRCTTTRRAFIHESVYDTVVNQLKSAYEQLPIGHPADDKTLVGPLVDQQAFDAMQSALQTARNQGCAVYGGARAAANEFPDGWYAQPAIVEGTDQFTNCETETFAPILYCFKYSDFHDAVERNNAVPQGLSSSIFTTNLKEAEYFLSAAGSDCGLANVNAGTSGAEIGGAFGGEKATGGGRESGSDAWKGYMRRSTSTINYSDELPLAQGVTFNTGHL